MDCLSTLAVGLAVSWWGIILVLLVGGIVALDDLANGS